MVLCIHYPYHLINLIKPHKIFQKYIMCFISFFLLLCFGNVNICIFYKKKSFTRVYKTFNTHTIFLNWLQKTFIKMFALECCELWNFFLILRPNHFTIQIIVFYRCYTTRKYKSCMKFKKKLLWFIKIRISVVCTRKIRI